MPESTLHYSPGNNQPPAPAPGRTRQRRTASRRLGDWVFRWLCKGSALLIVLLALLLFIVLLLKSWTSINTLGIGFLLETDWDPIRQVFGALPFVYGTLLTSLVAMAIAVPLGIGTAAFLAEIAPGWLRRSASFLVEMLAAIPSVVYGFWGFFVLAPFLDRLIPNSGQSIFSAGIILAIMIVPYITSVSFDVCRAVPRSQREGALALGATRWQTIWTVILPYARSGIIGGCFLGLGRALGETMAVTMLIGNSEKIPLTPFAEGNSIASKIANAFGESKRDPLYESVLVELGLVLMVVTILVNSLARLLIWRMSARKGKKLSLFNWRRARSLSDSSTNLEEAAPPPPPSYRRARIMNGLMTGVLGLCLVLTLGPLFLIFGYLVFKGIGSINLGFFINLPLDGGLANALIGSGILVGLATLFAVPIGLLGAIYLAEYRSGWLGKTVRFIGELLAGVPSIVIGIFAFTLVVRPLGLPGLGGAFALGVMMIPIVLRTSEESLKLVPGSLRNASHALGAAQWQTVLRVTVPAALPAIVTGVFLAIARIGGETAPLLLTAGSNDLWPNGVSDYIPSLPMFVYNFSQNPDPNKEKLAWAGAFVLLTLVLLLNFGIRLLTGKRQLTASRAD